MVARDSIAEACYKAANHYLLWNDALPIYKQQAYEAADAVWALLTDGPAVWWCCVDCRTFISGPGASELGPESCEQRNHQQLGCRCGSYALLRLES